MRVNSFSNHLHASVITSNARTKLYKFFMKFGEHNVIYCDTDAAIVKRTINPLTNQLEPFIELGISMGSIQNELHGKSSHENESINEFLGTGSKSYAIALKQSGIVQAKLKGIRLTHRAVKKINYDTFVKLCILDHSFIANVEYPYHISRNKRECKIYYVNLIKSLSFTADLKRIILPCKHDKNGDPILSYSLPFGYTMDLVQKLKLLKLLDDNVDIS